MLALASSAPNAYHHRRQHDHHRRQNVGLDTDPTNMQPTPTCYIAHEKRCIEPGNRAMDRFSCNQCDCLENGQMVCTEMACQRPVCDYAGRLWAVNQTFNDPLSDNRCVCTENKVVMCTMMYSPKSRCSLRHCFCVHFMSHNLLIMFFTFNYFLVVKYSSMTVTRSFYNITIHVRRLANINNFLIEIPGIEQHFWKRPGPKFMMDTQHSTLRIHTPHSRIHTPHSGFPI